MFGLNGEELAVGFWNLRNEELCNLYYPLYVWEQWNQGG